MKKVCERKNLRIPDLARLRAARYRIGTGQGSTFSIVNSNLYFYKIGKMIRVQEKEREVVWYSVCLYTP